MANLPVDVLDAALSRFQAQQDDALSRQIRELAEPVRRTMFGGLPALPNLLQGLNLGQPAPEPTAQPAQQQQQPSGGFQMPTLDSLLSGLDIGPKPEQPSSASIASGPGQGFYRGPERPESADPGFYRGNADDGGDPGFYRPGYSVSSTGASAGYAPSSGGGAEGVERWSSLITEAARAYNLPEATIKGLMEIESGGNPEAVSAAGALGLMQVMPFHFTQGENGKDPRTNIMRGAKVYADALARYGDPDKAAAAYFGAIDGNGNITSATDATGTDGHKYVALWRSAAAKYGGASPNAGAAPVPAAPAASPPRPPATGARPTPAAGGSGGGEIVVRHKVTGLESRVTPDQLAQMTNRAEFEVVGRAPATQTPLSDAAPGPATGDAYRMPLGDDGDDLMLRGPLNLPTDPEATTSQEYDPRDADFGPREAYTDLGVQPSGGAPTVPEPAYSGSPAPPANPAAYGASGDEPPGYGPIPPTVADLAASGGRLPDGSTMLEMPLRPQYDLVDATATPPTMADGGEWLEVPTQPRGYGRDTGVAYGPEQPPAPEGETTAFAEQSMGLPDLTPVWDAGGRVIGYIQQAVATPIRPPERPKPLVGPYDLSNETAFPTQESRNRFTSEQASADVSAIPYQAAEAGRQSVEEAAQSFVDMVRAGREGRELAAAGNALWGALQVAGLPWTVAARTINAMLPELNAERTTGVSIGAGDVATSLDLVQLAVRGVNGLRTGALGRVLSPENLARADDAVHAPIEAARGIGTRVAGALERNAERVAAADARMAAEGSTVAPGTLGQIPEQFGTPYPDIRRDVRGTVRETLGEPSSEMLADSRFPREAVHPDLRAEGIGPRITPQVDTSSRLNAGFGVVPEERGLVPQRSGLERGSRGAVDDMDTWNPLPDYSNPVEVLERDIGSHRREIARLEAALDGTGDQRWAAYASEHLPQYRAELADMERQYERLIGGDLPVESIPSRPSGTSSASHRSDPLSAVNRVLGQGVASAVSGGVGAQVNQQMNPDDPNAAAKGFVAGALGPVAAARGAGALARRAGAGSAAADGTLALFGALPPSVGRRWQQAQQKAAAQAAAARTAGKAPPPTAGDWMRTIGYSAMIGPSTGIVNAVGNGVELLWHLPKDALRAVVRGRPGEAAVEAKGLAAGLVRAGGEMLDALAGAHPGGGVETARLSQRVQNPVGQLAAGLLEAPTRLFSEVPDAFYRSIATSMGEYRRAAQIASDEGLSGRAWGQRVDDLLAGVAQHRAGQTQATPETVSIIKDGVQTAERLTLRGEVGPKGKAFQGLIQSTGWFGHLLFPFFNTPYQMTQRMLERTPQGLRMGTQPSRFDKQYDAIAGTLLMGGMAGLGMSGLITGSGPDDPEQRKALQAQGWQANSTLVAGTWIPNNAFGVFGPLLDAAGEAGDLTRYPKKDGTDRDFWQGALKRAGNIATNQVYLRGVADIVRAVSSPGEKGEAWAASTASRLIPGGASLRLVAGMEDPYERRADPAKEVGSLENIRQRVGRSIPNELPNPIVGTRGQLPVDQDILGRPVENQRQGVAAFGPKTSTPKSDPVLERFQRAGVEIGPPRSEVADDGATIDITPSETRRWNEIRGQEIVRATQRLIDSGALDRLSQQRAAERLDEIKASAAERATSAIRREVGGAEWARRRREARTKARAS